MDSNFIFGFCVGIILLFVIYLIWNNSICHQKISHFTSLKTNEPIDLFSIEHILPEYHQKINVIVKKIIPESQGGLFNPYLPPETINDIDEYNKEMKTLNDYLIALDDQSNSEQKIKVYLKIRDLNNMIISTNAVLKITIPNKNITLAHELHVVLPETYVQKGGPLTKSICDNINSSDGDYCVSRFNPVTGSQLCWFAKDMSGNGGFMASKGQINCSDINCEETQKLCYNKPYCDEVESECLKNDNSLYYL